MLHQINDTTYSVDGLGDVRQIIKLGGSDASKFAPNMNIGFSFGGGEEYFDNINRIDKITNSKSDVRFDGKKVQLIAGSDIDEVYVDDKGRFKWDVIFEKCPESMVIEWKRKCSPGLSAFYQDSLENEWAREPHDLSLEEYIATHIRPDDVIGSYAIYCDKANNYIRPLNNKREIPANWKSQLSAGAALADVNIHSYREYKTGKVGHKHRPFVIDANGKTAWCSLLIIGNIERVTLPESFMQSAVYPVRLDPTFGYTTAGASYDVQYITDQPYGSMYNPHSASSGDTITSFSMYGYMQSVSTRINIAAYSIASSMLDSRLASPVAVPVTSSTAAWWNSSTVSQSLVADTVYGLALGVYGESGEVAIAYDTDWNGPGTKHNTAETLPATWSNNSLRYKRYSLYATYAEGGSGDSGIFHFLRNSMGRGYM